MTARRRRTPAALSLLVAFTLFAAGCTSEEADPAASGGDAASGESTAAAGGGSEEGSASGGESAAEEGSASDEGSAAGDESASEETSASEEGSDGTAQVVASPSEVASGEGCTPETYAGGVEPIDLSEAVVGFSQSEREANPFRIAETESIRAEAAAVGVENLIVTNAEAELSKQISDIQDMLAQGAEVLIVAPLNSDGLEPALTAAAEQGVPVLTIDRKVNATHCEDYLAFIGSDFLEQGRRAATAMIEATGGEGQVAILLGSPGNNVTEQRTDGFVEVVEAEAPGLEIVAQQTGNFSREEGQQVMEQLIQANPGITAVYAENDEMALGAIVALRDAGRDPGPGGDVAVVSIDGTRNAVQAIVDGDINAVIESNPRFGPLAFETIEAFFGGEAIPEDIIISDREYDEANAAADVGTAY